MPRASAAAARTAGFSQILTTGGATDCGHLMSLRSDRTAGAPSSAIQCRAGAPRKFEVRAVEDRGQFVLQQPRRRPCLPTPFGSAAIREAGRYAEPGQCEGGLRAAVVQRVGRASRRPQTPARASTRPPSKKCTAIPPCSKMPTRERHRSGSGRRRYAQGCRRRRRQAAVPDQRDQPLPRGSPRASSLTDFIPYPTAQRRTSENRKPGRQALHDDRYIDDVVLCDGLDEWAGHGYGRRDGTGADAVAPQEDTHGEPCGPSRER